MIMQLTSVIFASTGVMLLASKYLDVNLIFTNKKVLNISYYITKCVYELTSVTFFLSMQISLYDELEISSLRVC